MCAADGDTVEHHRKVQGHGLQRETPSDADQGEHEQASEKDVRDVRHQPFDLIPSGEAYLRKHHLSVTGDSDRDRQQNHGTSAYHYHTAVCESHAGQDRPGCGLPEQCYRWQIFFVGNRHRPITDSERLQPTESQSEYEATGVHN